MTTTRPRFLVGVMHCIENEFDECMEAIHAQEGVDLEVFVIRNKPNKEAHDELYQTFMSRAAECDYFVKVDADMVLMDSSKLRCIHEKMRKNPWAIRISMGLHDTILDQMVEGMHCFRSSKQWEKRSNNLFTDEDNEDRSAILRDMADIAPVAWHCPNPGNFQAFHYGMHRGVKLMSLLQKFKHKKYSMRMHSSYLRQIRKMAGKSPTRPRLLAAIGAELALQGVFAPEHISYTNPFAKEIANEYSALQEEQLLEEIGRLRWRRIYCPLLMSRLLYAHMTQVVPHAFKKQMISLLRRMP